MVPRRRPLAGAAGINLRGEEGGVVLSRPSILLKTLSLPSFVKTAAKKGERSADSSPRWCPQSTVRFGRADIGFFGFCEKLWIFCSGKLLFYLN